MGKPWWDLGPIKKDDQSNVKLPIWLKSRGPTNKNMKGKACFLMRFIFWRWLSLCVGKPTTCIINTQKAQFSSPFLLFVLVCKIFSKKCGKSRRTLYFRFIPFSRSSFFLSLHLFKRWKSQPQGMHNLFSPILEHRHLLHSNWALAPK